MPPAPGYTKGVFLPMILSCEEQPESSRPEAPEELRIHTPPEAENTNAEEQTLGATSLRSNLSVLGVVTFQGRCWARAQAHGGRPTVAQPDVAHLIERPLLLQSSLPARPKCLKGRSKVVAGNHVWHISIRDFYGNKKKSC